MSGHPVNESSSQPLSRHGAFGVFADGLLANELPDLPDDRRARTVAFVCDRARVVPTPLRAGITAISIATSLGQHVFGVERTTAFLQATTLPFVGELARMVRSLGFAFVWETWPATTPTGAAA